MINYLTLPTGKSSPHEVNAVIEIPRGQTNKYEYDKQLHVFRLDRNLYSPVHYPDQGVGTVKYPRIVPRGDKEAETTREAHAH